ncbi:MAG: hypothetical protein ACFFBD_12530, partial [Candidatus Hodarchaeota archaeon]
MPTKWSENTIDKNIDQNILGILEKDDPETVEELIQLINSRYSIQRNEIINHILYLQNQGKITFKKKE